MRFTRLSEQIVRGLGVRARVGTDGPEARHHTACTKRLESGTVSYA
jgi:hypothetical protein